jgi:thiol:disulfide interchange protein DsbD
MIVLRRFHTKSVKPRPLRLWSAILLALFIPQFYCAAAACAQDGLTFAWRFYQLSSAVAPEAPIAGRISAETTVLVLDLLPAEEHYLYAPFAGNNRASAEGKPEEAELYLPVKVTLLGAEEQPLPDAQVFFPPGVLKYDAFAGAELPVYPEGVSLLVPLPASRLEQKLFAAVESVLCSSNSCLLFKKTFELAPPAEAGANPEQLPERIRARLAEYRPYDPIERESALLPSADTAYVQPEDYAAMFTPRFFNAGLEVYGLGQAVLLGFLAGFILNFMPCVLPVVTLKLGVLAGLGGLKSLSGHGSSENRARKRLRTYGLFFSLGVFAWFAALFAVIGLAGMMWGQFFQSETLLLSMAVILFLLSLSLLGVFRLPLLHVAYENSDPGSEKSKKSFASGSLRQQAFAGGLLATLMATPCSGPLLGGVLSWAVGEPLPFLALALGSVGAGMAAPFLLLGLKPDLARFFPRPGGWNLVLERIMAFLLLGTVIYLLSILPAEKLVRILYSLLLLSIAAWLWGRKTSGGRAGLTPGILASALLAAFALYFAFTGQNRDPGAQSAANIAWQRFTPEKFSSVLGRKNILLDFTADWCINCRVMEATTLAESNRAKWRGEHDLVYMQADLTRENIPAQTLLKALGSAGIPLIAIFPAGDRHGAPLVLRDISITGQVEAALALALLQKQ